MTQVYPPPPAILQIWLNISDTNVFSDSEQDQGECKRAPDGDAERFFRINNREQTALKSGQDTGIKYCDFKIKENRIST